MKFLAPFLCFLAFTQTLHAAPSRAPPEEKELLETPPWKLLLQSLSWKTFLPTIGALGILGAVMGIVALGNKADDAYTKHRGHQWWYEKSEKLQKAAADEAANTQPQETPEPQQEN
jgi:hypothetical protein